MNQKMGMLEFFAMEAGEYVERLDQVVVSAPLPSADELLRLCRALRGSALMANQQDIGNVAAGLESVARAVKETRLGWDEATKQLTIRSIDDLKIFIRNVREWTGEHADKAQQLAAELNNAAGVAQPAPRPASPEPIDAGTRAFIAREGSAVASALDQVAKGLQRRSVTDEQLDAVARVMQPLRGLALLNDLPPLPDVLDGVERAVTIARTPDSRTNELALLFDVAARALSTAAQAVAGTGAAQPDSHEAADFARRLTAFLESSADVVPVESLYYDDGGPHVVKRGTPPAAPARLVELEIVAHGEHLRQAADELERAQWDTQRELRALALAGTFRSLVSATGGPLATAVAAFANAAREAVSRGAAVHYTERFVGQLREAGRILSQAGGDKEENLAEQLNTVLGAVLAIPAGPASEAIAQPADGALHRPKAPSAEVGELEPVFTPSPQPAGPPEPPPPPVDDLPTETRPFEVAAATSGRAAGPPAAPAPAPAEPEPASPRVAPRSVPVTRPAAQADLVDSWMSYEKSLESDAPSEGPLEEIFQVAAEPAGQTESIGVPAAEPEIEPDVIVPIAELCYSGAAAMERVHELRGEIRGALRAPALNEGRLSELVEELVDLVELSIPQPG